MPCRDYTPEEDNIRLRRSYEDQLKEQQKKLDNLTQLLCSTCYILEATGVVIPAFLLSWWTEHQRLDRLREEAEQEERNRKLTEQQRQERRKELISKMSVEDRGILGL